METAWPRGMLRVLQNPTHRLRVKQGPENSEKQLEKRLKMHLGAMAHAAVTPVAEVLAVIGEQTIIILAEPRARTSNDLLRRKRRRGVVDDAYRMTPGKSKQGHFLDRSALPESPGEP